MQLLSELFVGRLLFLFGFLSFHLTHITNNGVTMMNLKIMSILEEMVLEHSRSNDALCLTSLAQLKENDIENICIEFTRSATREFVSEFVGQNTDLFWALLNPDAHKDTLSDIEFRLIPWITNIIDRDYLPGAIASVEHSNKYEEN